MQNNTDERLAEAETLAIAGQLEQAMQISWGVLVQEPVNKKALAVVSKILFLAGLNAEQNAHVEAAYTYYSRAISFDGDLVPARDRLMALIPDFIKFKIPDVPGTLCENQKQQATLVLCIGTGRSGSTSFTRLLSMQAAIYFTHEHPPKLPWVPDQGRFEFHVRRFRELLTILPYAGDASHWWLPYLESLLNEFPSARIVVLQRGRDDTVKSFESVLGQGESSQNHWVDHRGEGWMLNPWDLCFPKYPVTGRKEAIGLYWDEYYSRAGELAEKYPENILMCNLAELSDPEGQAAILHFCGFEDPVIVPDIALNKGTTKDGTIHY